MSGMGRKYTFKPPTARAPLVFWAERGMIHIIDERLHHDDEKSYVVVMLRDWLVRLRSTNAAIGFIRWPDERQCHRNFVDDGIACAREASAQGRPDDPKATADMLRSRRRSMLYSGSAAGALPSGVAPESSLLPPVPNHPGVVAERGGRLVVEP